MDRGREGACRLSPATFLFRLGEESSVGKNSRLLLGDGTIYWVGPHDDAVRPTGPFDPELPVLAFRRRDGGLEAVLFNHSTHTIGTQKPGVRSPSFYGLAAQELEKERGGTFLFFEGASGSTHNLGVPATEATYRIRQAVAGALDAAAATGRPGGRDSARRSPSRSVSFGRTRTSGPSGPTARSGSRTPRSPSRPSRHSAPCGEALASTGAARKTWVQAVRIGDVAIVGVPGEFFTALGEEIKRRSPFRYTYVFELANDYIGYIPDQRGIRSRRLSGLDRPAQLPRAGDRRADRLGGRRATRPAPIRSRRRPSARDRSRRSQRPREWLESTGAAGEGSYEAYPGAASGPNRSRVVYELAGRWNSGGRHRPGRDEDPGAVVGSDHRILGRAKRTTPAKEGGPAILEAMIDCVDEALRTPVWRGSESPRRASARPGPLDINAGVILFSANLNVRELSDRAGAVGGTGPARPGAERRTRRRLRRVSAGCRAGLPRDHRGLRRHRDRRLRDPGGRDGRPGRPATRVRSATSSSRRAGPRCGCGARGCLEALASKTAIGRRVQKAVRKGLAHHPRRQDGP